MLARLKQIISRDQPEPPAATASVPPGQRVYAIGDIHGRLDLFAALVEAIEADDAAAEPAETTVILLGDLVDRGPDSAGVIAATRDWQRRRNVRVLMGNHEEMFLQAFEKPEILRHFLKHGGRETILSYGLSRKSFNTLELEDLLELLPNLVPPEERDYIAAFEEMVIAGDYVFVHAGVDPAQPLEAQKRSDLLWIRDRFLDHEGPLEKVVVHGHTIFDRVMDCGNRIGIDTGAFRSGVLTALVLEADQKRIIQACQQDAGPVEIFHGNRSG